VWETAREFDATVVFAEHRYYGESMPYGQNSYDNKSRLGYLTSQQALADYVDLISHLKRRGSPRHTSEAAAGPQPRCGNPVIAFGGSYGGMLAAWFRIKYPAVVEGFVDRGSVYYSDRALDGRYTATAVWNAISSWLLANLTFFFFFR